ncbi:TIGR03943 family putative permease subunit [Cytobacillus praedii]|uniref:TIGR03943 family putative permease subunit n=1 Tax=Cytobacillus praedii TaxID=1742358 RepID=UPI002E23487B|nr:TIGR03943 family protein [Cytobacillus praedii]
MKFNFQQSTRAIILFAFSAMLFKMHFTGDLTKYINPKYELLSQSASVLFLILFFIQLTRIWTVKEQGHQCHHDDHACTHDHGDSNFNTKKLLSYGILIFPLITGFLLPPKVLDASIVDKKGGMAILSNQKKSAQKNEETNSDPAEQADSSEPIEHSTDQSNLDFPEEVSQEEYDKLIQKLEQSPNIEMNDYVFSPYYEEISLDVNRYKGRNITLTGFVYKEEGFEQNQLVLSRFLITHCVADASIIGFLSEFSEAASVEEDTWIEATGVLDVTTYAGNKLPIIKITDWKKINEPAKPYLYPVNIKIL